MEDRYDYENLKKETGSESEYKEEYSSENQEMKTDSSDENGQSINAGEEEDGAYETGSLESSRQSIIVGEGESSEYQSFTDMSGETEASRESSYSDSSENQTNLYRENAYQETGYTGNNYQGNGYGGNYYQGNGYTGNAYRANTYQGNNYYNNTYSNGTYHNGGYWRADQNNGRSNNAGADGFYQNGTQNGRYGNYTGESGASAQHTQKAAVPPRRKEKKKNKNLAKVCMTAGLAILFGVVCGGAFLLTNSIGNHFLAQNEKGSEDNASPVENVSLTKNSSVITSDVSEMVENVMPSVVSITNMTVEQVQSFFGGVYERQSESAGTGIIVAQTDDELLIVTNYHVIENSDTLTVAFCDESSATANLKGSDSEHDVAVIAVQLTDISAETRDHIGIATMGDSTTLKVGEPAIAIGNALGYGQSVTTGVISALNREISTTDEYTGEVTKSSVRMIQTDAVINRGNSGGALLNANGEVIGINSAKLSGDTVEGIGYAIPISDVSDIIDNLMNQKTKRKVAADERGMLGIQGRDVPSESAEWFNMPLGVYVDSVEKGSGAEEAGLTKGNIITALNGTSITSMQELISELEYYAAGETVSVTIGIPENNGEYSTKTVEIKLMKKS